MHKKTKGSALLGVIWGVIVIGIIAGGIWYYEAHQSKISDSFSVTTTSTIESTTTPITSKNIPALSTSTTVNPIPGTVSQADLLAMAGDPYADGILPLGDGKYTTTAPKKGYVYLCNVAPDGQGAESDGPWIGTSTWNSNEKISVEGSVSWPQADVNISVHGSTRTITSNDLPTVGTTGIFPIPSNDPAYQYDMNPNSIEAQNLSFAFPADPTIAATPGCIYGEVGVMTNGVLLLDAFDAEYRDAPAHEILDSCDGHPHEGGMYHYHDLSSCIPNAMETTVIGWAFDGFPITGPEVAPGKYLTTADLDECHGITSDVDINGTMVDTYHYVMTQDFPYSVSCFRGKSYEPKPTANGGMNMGTTNTMSGMPMTGSNSNTSQTPPQAAIDACEGKNSSASCSFSTPNGTLSGTCNETPGNAFACIPNNP